MVQNKYGETYEAIILWKKKGKMASVIPFVTKAGNIVRGVVNNNQLAKMKNSGYLQAFAHVYVTVQEGKEVATIKQVDGLSVVKTGASNLQDMVYIAFLGELVYKLFLYGGAQEKLFSLLSSFLTATKEKPLSLGTLVVGWQALQLAGFVPATKDLNHSEAKSLFRRELEDILHKNLGAKIWEGLLEVLAYSWEVNGNLLLDKETWSHIEHILFRYSEGKVGEKFDSLRFKAEMDMLSL